MSLFSQKKYSLAPLVLAFSFLILSLGHATENAPEWPTTPHAPTGAPNVLLILTDDVGFAAASSFGGSIPTPAFDRLAAHGLKYNRFHTTAICSATRAALLTGRNHHRVSMGTVASVPSGVPGHNTVMPKSAATIAEVLKQNGYNTVMFGKWHLTPRWETSIAGPFDRWPTGMGFEYFYGFLDGDADQWAPQLYLNTVPIEPPSGDPGYILDKDMADQAITWLATQNAVAPKKPFFMYYATGTAHAPHHAPKEWISKFGGAFDGGWDEFRAETFARQKELGIIPADAQLTERPEAIPAWDSLPADRKALFSRMMEVYAAALAHADYQIGRIIGEIERSGELDNTLIIFIQGDNGSSAEGGDNGLFNELSFINNLADDDYSVAVKHIDDLGGPLANNHFPAGWAHALSTPFPYFKRVASHLGATSNAMVISWPAKFRIPQNENGLRSQYHHVIDVAPTILAAAGIPIPKAVNGVKQMTLDGVSMMYTFDSSDAPSQRRTQIYEVSSDAAIYHDGWLASTHPTVMPWERRSDDVPFSEKTWELYNLSQDFSQANNIAENAPDKLADLKTLFIKEAKRNQIFPISRRHTAEGAPDLRAGRTDFSYVPGIKRLTRDAAPNVKNRSFSIIADIEVEKGDQGVLVTQGGRFGGYGLLIENGVPVFYYNLAGVNLTSVKAPTQLTPGRHKILVDFDYDGGGSGKGGDIMLSVDGYEVANGRTEKTMGYAYSLSETFDVGEDTGTPVSESYRPPYRFTGKLHDLTVTLE